jgi:hypothetical protein
VKSIIAALFLIASSQNASADVDFRCNFNSNMDGIPSFLSLTGKKTLTLKLGLRDFEDDAESFNKVDLRIEGKGEYEVIKIFYISTTKTMSFSNYYTTVEKWLEISKRDIYLKTKVNSNGGIGNRENDTSEFLTEYNPEKDPERCNFTLKELKKLVK